MLINPLAFKELIYFKMPNILFFYEKNIQHASKFKGRFTIDSNPRPLASCINRSITRPKAMKRFGFGYNFVDNFT